MNRSKLTLLITIALTALVAVFPPACEDPILAADLLTQPRIMAIRSEPPDLIPLSQDVPAGQVTLDALLYLPPGSPAPTYTWSWCAAVGATLQCTTTAAELLTIVDPGGGSGLSINYALGSNPTAVFTYPVAPAILESLCVQRPNEDGGLDDGGLDGAADDAGEDAGLAGRILCTGDSWPVSILLTVNVGSTTLQAERSLTVYLAPPATTNTNPTIDALSPFPATTALADGGALANPGDEADGGIVDAGIGSLDDGGIGLSALVPVTATDLYVGRVPGEARSDASAEDAGPCVPEDGGEEPDGGPICMPSPYEEVYESLSIAWYIGGGEIAETTTSMPAVAYGAPQDWSSLLLNRWTPPAQPGTYPLIAVIRDNRGGIGWLVQSATTPIK